MTLYQVSNNPDWGIDGPLTVSPVDPMDLFDEDGRLLCSPQSLYPTEAAALSHLTLQAYIRIQERNKMNQSAVKDFEELNERLQKALEAEGCTTLSQN